MAAMVAVLAGLLVRQEHWDERKRRNKYGLPLPPTCHMTLGEERLGGRDVLVIGDVHGCWEELCQLLRLAGQRRHRPFVIFAGDFINKGPNNCDVLSLVRELVTSGQAEAIRGNHEESVLRNLWHLLHNPNSQLKEGLSWQYNVSDSDFHFLQALPYTLSLPSRNAIVVHAGLEPGLPLHRQSLVHLTHMRCLAPPSDPADFRTLVPTNRCVGREWGAVWGGPEHVYFGHHARRGLQRHSHATGLDTGCLYGGRLTAVFIGDEPLEFVSVPARQAYVSP